MKKLTLLVSMLFIMAGSLMAQRAVVGKVTDASGDPLPGATVLVKGTNNGTVTDDNGNYKVDVPANASMLVVSYTGFNTQEVALGVSNVVNVTLLEGVTLSETVVTALGTEVSREKTGVAATKVTGDALRSSAETGLINSLAGKSAGVNITQASGEPGAGSKIQIRGATSITGSLSPLIILDGIPINNDSQFGQGSTSTVGSDGGVTQQSRLNDIPAQDIENVEVLRGASAAALWGSRAANGVIVITTKKGKSAGRKGWTVDFNSAVSFDQLNKEVELQDKFGQGNNGLYQFNPAGGRSWGDKISSRPGGEDTPSSTTGAKFTAADGSVYFPIANGTATNVHGGKNSRQTYSPYDAIFQTGTTYDNSISLNNVDNLGNVYFSLGRLSQDGIIKSNSNYDRTNARLNIIRKIGNKFTIDASTGYTLTNSNRIQMGSNLSGLFLGGLRTPADYDLNDYTGTYTDANGTSFIDRQRAYPNPLGANTSSIYDNPLWMIENVTSTSIVNRFIGRLDLKYDFTDWFTLTTRAGIDQYSDDREDYYPAIAAGANNGGTFIKENINFRGLNYNIFGTFRKSFGANVASNLTLGMNFTDDRTNSGASKNKGFINPLSPPNAENATSKQTFDETTREKAYRYYGTMGWEFYNQLYVNLSGSLDYLSTLSDNNNGIFYPAVDVAWNAAKVLNIPNVTTLKLRGGYGQVGRGPSPYLTSTGFLIPDGTNSPGFIEGWGAGLNPGVYGGGSAINSDAGNPNLKPEVKTETEFGLDLGLFKERLRLGATVYNNVTKDLILLVDVPESTGFNRQASNAGEIKNNGVELEVGFTPIRNKDFSWEVYGNWTRNKNEVTKMAGVNSFFLGGFEGSASRAIVGQQLGVIWGSKWERGTDGKLVLDDLGFPVQAEVEGFLGDPNPDFRAGIGTRLSYKNWNLNILFDMAQGIDMWNGTKGALAFFGRAGLTGKETTLSKEQAESIKNYNGVTVAEQWPGLVNSDGSYTVRGEIKDFGAGNVFLDEYWYRVGPGSGFTGPTEQFVEDASWTRLREVTLSYRLPIKSKYISGATLSFTGRNLLLFTDYTGNDPDQNLTGAGLNALGLDYFNNPAARSYRVALNLNF